MLPPIPTAVSRTLPGRSLQEVAKALGYTVAEVRHIEALALLKMRDGCERKGIDRQDLAELFSLMFSTLP